MEHKTYEQHKTEFDDMVMSYIAKRIFEDINKSPAFINGVIDANGSTITKGNGWDYTNLDRFVMALRQRVGEDSLRDLLSVYSGYSDVNDLMIIKSLKKPIDNKRMIGLKRIVSKVESLGYLDEVRSSGDYVSPDDESMDRKISWALTVLVFLMYSLRLDRPLTSIEFDANVIPSVEVTFYISANRDFSEIKEFIDSGDLLTDGKVNGKAIRAMVSCAKDMITYGILTKDGSRIEDQSRNWEKLGERG